MKKGLIINEDVWDLVDELEDDEYAEFVLTLKAYHKTGEMPECSRYVRMILKKIISDNDRFAGVSEARAEAGRKGAEARWQSAANDGNDMANDSNAIANDGKNGIDKTREDIEKETPTVSRKRFVPPSVGDVAEYCLEHRYQVDPERFVDFYASKGWVVGKSPMKDWKAAVRTWAKERKEQTPPNRSPKIQAAYGFSTERVDGDYNEIAMQRAWQEG